LPGSQSLIVAAITAGSRPRLRRGVRLVFDATRGTRVLLYPEGVIVPNETAAEVLGRCDGVATVGAITAELAAQYDGVQAEDVIALLARLAERRFVEVADEPGPGSDGARPSETAPASSPDPALSDTHPGVTHPAGIAPADGAPPAEGDPR
jgi:pyrroloquinoline quinone biosynthesis protein D